VNALSEAGASRKSFQQVSSHFLHFSQSNCWWILPIDAVKKFQRKMCPFRQRHLNYRISAQTFITLPDQPGIVQDTSTYHDSIDPSFSKQTFCILWNEDISISYYRYPCFFFYSCNHRPVSPAIKHVTARSSVNRQRFDSTVLSKL